MHHTQVSVAPPTDFHFEPTVNSHGWDRLEPFKLDRETQVLRRIERLPSQSARLEISQGEGQEAVQVSVHSEAPLTDEDRNSVRSLVKHCLSFDWDLSECYAQVAQDPHYRFIKDRGLGRLLVAPSMWENLVKTVFLTNANAHHIRSMAAKFCTLGDPYGDQHLFPTPEQVLAKSVEELEVQTGTGYRAKYLRSLAESVVGGFDPESLRDPALSYEDLFERVRALRGFGPYSAAYVLKLLGRFERVTLDTVMRRYFKDISGRDDATDDDISAYYERFGKYKGLVAWWEVSRLADEKGDLSF